MKQFLKGINSQHSLKRGCSLHMIGVPLFQAVHTLNRKVFCRIRPYCLCSCSFCEQQFHRINSSIFRGYMKRRFPLIVFLFQIGSFVDLKFGHVTFKCPTGQVKRRLAIEVFFSQFHSKLDEKNDHFSMLAFSMHFASPVDRLPSIIGVLFFWIETLFNKQFDHLKLTSITGQGEKSCLGPYVFLTRIDSSFNELPHDFNVSIKIGKLDGRRVLIIHCF